MNLETKTQKLRQVFRDMESVVVGYSGGIDSTLVMKVAHEELGDKALAVIADSESLLRSELDEAVELAKLIGVNFKVVQTSELSNPNYSSNPTNRCFFCKDELFTHLTSLAHEEGRKNVADGANADDTGDHRPGLAAAADHEVRHPLQEAGFTKEDVRSLAKQLCLPNWDKPALACLASRFPYGTEITSEKLAMVGAAEEFLKAKGFRGYRVRHHEAGSDFIARIDLAEEDFPRFNDADLRSEIDKALRETGYHFVALDLQGYRSGRLNDALGRQVVQIRR